VRAALALAASLALAAPALAGDAAAEAALERMIGSQSAVLDTLEAIEDRASLEARRAQLMDRLARARIDTDSLAAHAEAFSGSSALRAALAREMRAYNARRDRVYADIVERLDEETLDRLDEIFDEAE
jgi:ABC-type iron transport system FetAB ATPase subunit